MKEVQGSAVRRIQQVTGYPFAGPLALVFLMLLLVFTGPGHAYPTKFVRLIASTSPGSGSDTIARIIAKGLTDAFEQQVVVDNRAGAGGNIGAELASRAPADGYTLFMLNMGHAANVTLYKNMKYDLLTDFAPVVQFTTAPSIIVVHPSLPVKSLAELVALAKSKPGTINYSSGGIGSPSNIAGEKFKTQAGIDMMHIPYKSGGESLTAVISGECSVFFSPIATALPHVREGRLRALAVTTLKRTALLPNYPTVSELGYPGYTAGNWYGIVVPAKTPKETIAIIRNAALKALKHPETSKRMFDLGYVPVGGTPEEFMAFVKDEVEKLAVILKKIKMSPGK